MILPAKHVRLAESLLGLGAFLLDQFAEPTSLDTAWAHYRKAFDEHRYAAYHPFESFILAVDFLFAIGAIDEDPQGRLIRCDS